MEEKAAGLMSGDSGTVVCVPELREQARSKAGHAHELGGEYSAFPK